MNLFLWSLLILISSIRDDTIYCPNCLSGSIDFVQLNADTIPKSKALLTNTKGSFSDRIDEHNILKAEINGSISLMHVRSDIKKDYRIIGYEQPSLKSNRLLLFSVFTRDVENNPYKCFYGSFYSTNDFSFVEREQ